MFCFFTSLIVDWDINIHDEKKVFIYLQTSEKQYSFFGALGTGNIMICPFADALYLTSNLNFFLNILLLRSILFIIYQILCSLHSNIILLLQQNSHIMSIE